MNRLLTYEEVCKILGVSRSTFNRNFVYPGRVKKTMVGPNSPRFDEVEVAVAVYRLQFEYSQSGDNP